MNNAEYGVHDYAFDIEYKLRNVFNCSTGGFGGLIDTNFIAGHPIHAIRYGLAYIYKDADELKRKSIDDFINEFSSYTDMHIKTILSFETDSKEIDTTYKIPFKNGHLLMGHILKSWNNFNTLTTKKPLNN